MEPAYLKVLSLKESDLSAEQRYFLLRASALFGDQVVDQGVRELEKAIGMSPRAFREARDSLLAKGFLVRPESDEAAAVRGSQVGRPRASFRLAQTLRTAAAKEMQRKSPQGVADLIQRMTSSPFKDLIQELVFWRQPEDASAASSLDKLRPATRLLLATLVGLADNGGVVRAVGLGRLAHLVGMKRERLEYQLDILAALGFIRARITGLTGRYLFGQVAGAIFLDLAHEAYAARISQVVVCIQDEAIGGFEATDFIDGRLIYEGLRNKTGGKRAIKNEYWGSLKPFSGLAAEAHRDGRLIRDVDLAQVRDAFGTYEPEVADEPHDGVLHIRSGFDPEEGLLGGQSIRMASRLWDHFELHHFFVGSPYKPFGQYFQYMIDELVGQMLSHHWGSIRPRPRKVIPELWARIDQELITPLNLRELQEWDAPACLKEALCFFVYLVVLRRAYWFKSVLCFDVSLQSLGGSLANCDFVLLPPGEGTPQRLAVAVTPRDGRRLPAKYAVVGRRAGPASLPPWQLGPADHLPVPAADELTSYWRHPPIRPAVVKGLASQRAESRGVRRSPEK